MAIALNTPSRTAAAPGASVLCWGRIVAISATLVFDVALVWGLARIFG